jgi:hypothetical protein
MRRPRMLVIMVSAAMVAALAVVYAQMDRPAPPDGVAVYLISPHPGEVIEGPVVVRFGLRGMGVAPAGVDHPNTGHHHLLINTPLDEVDLNMPLPATDDVLHFGGGQTEVVLELEPGSYTLQAVFADFRHVAFDPPIVSDVVTVHVR